jgi:hypothetical protein
LLDDLGGANRENDVNGNSVAVGCVSDPGDAERVDTVDAIDDGNDVTTVAQETVPVAVTGCTGDAV